MPRLEVPGTVDTSSLPVLTIHEVAKRTGISADALRAWERRYGVPRPQRNPAGFRLYAAHDVRQIVAMIRHRRAGIEPRQAAFLITRGGMIGHKDDSSSQVRRWRTRFERACSNFDDGETDAVVAEASQHFSRYAVLEQVLFPVVAMLGDGWHAGVIRVSQEHYASQVARRVATAYATSPAASADRSAIVAGCAPGEQHELGLLLVACALRDLQLPVTYLGPSVPVDSMLATLEQVGARVAVIAATRPTCLRSWRLTMTRVRRLARRGLLFVWAGPGAAQGARGLPGVITRSVEETAAVVAEYVAAREANPRRR